MSKSKEFVGTVYIIVLFAYLMQTSSENSEADDVILWRKGFLLLTNGFNSVLNFCFVGSENLYFFQRKFQIHLC